MDHKLPLTVCHLQPQNIVVVTLPADAYGSTYFEKLQALHDSLTKMADSTDEESVILDLSSVEISGSGFLACLDSFAKKLVSAQRQLIVCGDRVGLIRIVKWTQRLNYQNDLATALNWCALQNA